MNAHACSKSARIVNACYPTMRGEEIASSIGKPGRKTAVVRVMISGPTIRPFGKTIVLVVIGLLEDFFGVYHPERHYMRGPGPKWQEKHAVRAAALRPSADRVFGEAATYAAMPHR
jgi:hypothetical protein